MQHQDGHNYLMFSAVPNCVSYDPTFGYEMAVIIHHGLKRMYQDQEDVFFYVTAMNENYEHPAMPEGAEQGIIDGMYLIQGSAGSSKNTVQLLGAGAILREVMASATLLKEQFHVDADVWSVTSFNELRKNMETVAREKRLNPADAKHPISTVAKQFKDRQGPFVAATDYMKLNADQIRADVPGTYVVLGTDGYGRSDTRERLRDHFEVNASMIAYTALSALHDDGRFSLEDLQKAQQQLGIDPARVEPVKH